MLDPAPGAGRDDGEKFAVNPAGKPVAARVIALLNPPAMVVVILSVPVAPGVTLRLAAARVSLKVGLLASFQCSTNRKPSGDPSPLA
jgi:hypothetical protein